MHRNRIPCQGRHNNLESVAQLWRRSRPKDGRNWPQIRAGVGRPGAFAPLARAAASVRPPAAREAHEAWHLAVPAPAPWPRACVGGGTLGSAAPVGVTGWREQAAQRVDPLPTAPSAGVPRAPAPESSGPVPKASSPAHSSRASFDLAVSACRGWPGHPTHLADQPESASSSPGSGQLSRSRYPVVTISVMRKAQRSVTKAVWRRRGQRRGRARAAAGTRAGERMRPERCVSTALRPPASSPAAHGPRLAHRPRPPRNDPSRSIPERLGPLSRLLVLWSSRNQLRSRSQSVSRPRGRSAERFLSLLSRSGRRCSRFRFRLAFGRLQLLPRGRSCGSRTSSEPRLR